MAITDTEVKVTNFMEHWYFDFRFENQDIGEEADTFFLFRSIRNYWQ